MPASTVAAMTLCLGGIVVMFVTALILVRRWSAHWMIDDTGELVRRPDG